MPMREKEFVGADYYDKDYFETAGMKNELSDYFNKQEKEKIVVCDRLQKLLPLKKGCTILEVGCGYGQNVQELIRRGYVARGVDISKYAIFEGQKRLGISSMSLDISDRFFVPMCQQGMGIRRYDFVFSCITLEHLLPQQIPNALLNLASVTQRGGLHYHAIDLDCDESTHFSLFSRELWEEHFKNAGFIPLEISDEAKLYNWFLFKKI